MEPDGPPDPSAIFEALLMPDRMTTLLLERLRSLAARKTRFCYDVRADSHVYDGIVAPYRVETEGEETTALLPVLEHALLNDGMVSGVRDIPTGQTRYTSGRHYTDMGNALRFAREQGQPTVFNWNRQMEVSVGLTPSKPSIGTIEKTVIEG